jgi:hypothetical protein
MGCGEAFATLTDSRDDAVVTRRSNDMTQHQAESVARMIDGEPWQSGGNIWLVVKQRAAGRCVVLSGAMICEYASQEAFDDGQPPIASMLLC